MRDKEAWRRLAELREIEYEAVRKEARYRLAMYAQDKPEPIRHVGERRTRPDHFCTTGDSSKAKQDCARCMDRLYTSTTGRNAPSGYHGWRDEYAQHGTPYAFERMMGLVDENTEDMLTAKPEPVAAPVRRATMNRALRVAVIPLLIFGVVLFALDTSIGSVHLAFVDLFGIIVFATVIAVQTWTIKRVERQP
jgi:hypothetical protein